MPIAIDLALKGQYKIKSAGSASLGSSAVRGHLIVTGREMAVECQHGSEQTHRDADPNTHHLIVLRFAGAHSPVGSPRWTNG